MGVSLTSTTQSKPAVRNSSGGGTPIQRRARHRERRRRASPWLFSPESALPIAGPPRDREAQARCCVSTPEIPFQHCVKVPQLVQPSCTSSFTPSNIVSGAENLSV